MDLAGFKPENVQVSLKENVITVNAKMDEQSEDGLQRFSQSISQSYTLPENVELDKLKSVLSDEGMLNIEGPIKGGQAKEGPKEIPIQRNDSSTPQG